MFHNPDPDHDREQRVQDAAPLPMNSRHRPNQQGQDVALVPPPPNPRRGGYYVTPPPPTLPRRPSVLWAFSIIVLLVFGLSITSIAVYIGLTAVTPSSLDSSYGAQVSKTMVAPARPTAFPTQFLYPTSVPTVVANDMDRPECKNYPGYPKEILAYVHGSGGINERSGPSTSYQVTDGYGAGIRICLRGRTADEAWGMLHDDRWVYMGNIDLSEQSRANFSRLPITWP